MGSPLSSQVPPDPHRHPAVTESTADPLSDHDFEGIVPRAEGKPRRHPLNERDRAAADDWMRDHLPDPDKCSLEDSEEAGSTESYFFLRLRDSATVVYKVAVKDDKVSCGFTVVLKSDPAVPSDRSFGSPT